MFWADTWQLTASIEKIVLLQLSAKNPKRVHVTCNFPTEFKNIVKDSGEVNWKDLSRSYHCYHSEIFRKANYVANAILHSLLCSVVSVHIGAYNCYIKPILEHNHFVWISVDIDVIEKDLHDCCA